MRRKLAQTCAEPKPTDQRTANGPATIATKAAKEGAAAAAAAAAEAAAPEATTGAAEAASEAANPEADQRPTTDEAGNGQSRAAA